MKKLKSIMGTIKGSVLTVLALCLPKTMNFAEWIWITVGIQIPVKLKTGLRTYSSSLIVTVRSALRIPESKSLPVANYRAMVEANAGFRVEYSTDAGSSWQTLGTANDPNGTGWYNTASIPGLDAGPGWNVDSFAVYSAAYDITFLSGQREQATFGQMGQRVVKERRVVVRRAQLGHALLAARIGPSLAKLDQA